ncbi:MAG: histidine phosphatase family protein [Corynebacterium sp.]|uniref:histidine phosphatase family protein n=1 Tax=Corynebacterium sp. TaxID=1720 RepID=UPI0026DB19EE|nr:histidine phosphatase family protein [Corynebacterium sp.]MDO5030910.1 histidine phosphatase family protein [Corynebacterium sp.]
MPQKSQDQHETQHAKTTVVHLVRHGEVYNPDKILYGRLPGWHLSDRGQRQATATAASFEGHNVKYFACSPLQRTQETSKPFTDVLGMKPILDEDLLEAGNTFEGLHIKGIDTALWNPKYWPRLRRPSVPSWGEPYEEIADRMFAAIERARQAAEGAEAVLVTHQLCIIAAQRRARYLKLAHNPATRQCDLASVTSLVFVGDAIVDVRYSEPAGHL